jgi:hypothetical protein
VNCVSFRRLPNRSSASRSLASDAQLCRALRVNNLLYSVHSSAEAPRTHRFLRKGFSLSAPSPSGHG